MFSEKRVIGYWKEETYYFDNQNIRISLMDLKNKKAEYLKTEMLSYLKKGHYITGHPGYATDLFDNSKKIAGGRSNLTDGEWVWTLDVAYYVENYNIALPDDFVEYVKKNEYKISELDTSNIDELEYEFTNIIRV